MNILRIITLVLVLIGALNWGLIGMFDYDLVGSIFGDMSILSRIVYSLVGFSALFLIITERKMFSECDCLNYD